MGKSKTKVINQTGSNVDLKLNTGGILSRLREEPLRAGESYNIYTDTNTTYREYWCAVTNYQVANQDKVILSSDDCAEYSEVTLRSKDVAINGTLTVSRYEWEGTKKRAAKSKLLNPAPSSSSSAPAPSMPASSTSTVASSSTPRTQSSSMTSANGNPHLASTAPAPASTTRSSKSRWSSLCCPCVR